MKKEKVIEIGVLLGIIFLAVIVVVVAGNQRKNKILSGKMRRSGSSLKMG